MQKLTNLLTILIGISLTACGFHPIYQEKTVAERPQKFNITISGSNDYAYTQYKLRKELDILLPTIGQKTQNPLKVTINLTETYGNIAYTSNAKAQRSHAQLMVDINIFDGGISPIHTAKLESSTSYTVDYLEEFSTISAETGARERMIKNLAQDIAHELSLCTIPSQTTQTEK